MFEAAGIEGVRKFHIGDIMTITSNYMFSPRGWSGLHDLLEYMTGNDLTQLSFVRAADECEPSLCEQHPDLAALSREFPAGVESTGVRDVWLAQVVIPHLGETRPVLPLRPDDHTTISAMDELALAGLSHKAIPHRAHSSLTKLAEQAVDLTEVN